MPASHSAIARFEAALRTRLDSQACPLDAPLPTTRELARAYGVSNTSVHRVLRSLTEVGLLWRRENGRYYPAAARAQLERPAPVACLLRQLQNWAFAYQGVMSGVSEACGAAGRSMILTHNEQLVTHRDTSEPPVFGTAAAQEEALARFLAVHPEPLHGFVLDHLWRDEVLARFSDRLGRVAIVNRPTTLASASAVYPDFRLGATLALGHLAVQRYRRIIPVRPFVGDSFTDAFLDEFVAVAREMGLPLAQAQPVSAATPGERAALLQEVGQGKGGTALFCPEGNVARLLLEAVRAERLEKRIAVMSAGEEATARDLGLTTLVVPFRQIGAEAVALLDATTRPGAKVIITELWIGASTPRQ